jgi:predicted nucleotidyltransferase
MAKEKTIYTCTECGGISPKWLGKCPHCNAWSALVEPVAQSAAGKNRYSNPHQGLAKAFNVIAQADLVRTLQSRVPDLLAIYAFGSRIQGTAGPQSDLDLAVLVAGYADPVALWALSGDLADLAACPVDLLDLRAASTVMQYQIITTGQRWWARDGQAALYEAAVLSEKTALDTARAGLLDDIQTRGSIYG